MSAIKGTFKFTGKASFPKNAVVLIYDLQGFSQFFNQPDVQDYIPAFLNNISNAISVCLLGGKPFWEKGQDNFSPLSIRVVHEKFLGDGALYLFLPPKGKSDFAASDLRYLCNRLWNLQRNFSHLLKCASSDVPVFELPARIRFGLARGSVYELRSASKSTREYIGFAINLASRLQKYCPPLGFLASARLKMSDEELAKHGYKKVVATKIPGFPKELVIVDTNGFNRLEKERREFLFETL